MCGIAGHLAFPAADAEAVRRMTAELEHRGPDGAGFYNEGPIALGHRRLAIIDLEGGAQPVFNEDRTVAVVFNGEIYNYRELASELSSRHRFRTASDTETLVHLYEDLGEEMLPRLRGMFAFAIWDAPRRRLFAARDRFGKKPFVYMQARGQLWFASEVRALARSGASLGSVAPEALSDYLELLYVPAPRTIWSGVRKLEAGHSLVADEHGVTVRRYWSPPTPGSDAAPVAPQNILETLQEATRLRLRSDVPLAVLLSGGIDSSAVTALAAREVGPGLKTFAVGFGRDDDELPHARLVAERYRTEHHEVLIKKDPVGATQRALDAYSEPFGDSSSVPSVEVFREVSKHVKVVLTGDGGDELFAGYSRYRDVERLPYIALARVVARTLSPLDRFARLQRVFRGARVLGTRGGMRNRALTEVFSPRARRDLIGEVARVAPMAPDLPTNLDSALAFDLGVYLPDDLLVKTDIASMCSSLEARCPLLDHVLAEQVIPSPLSAKQNSSEGKLGLKRAIAGLLPESILSRPKRGFGSPVASWLRGPLRPMLGDLVGARDARIRAWLDGANVDNVVRDAMAGRGNPHQAWALLALEGWARRHG